MYNLRKTFSRQRKRIASKLGNPRILQIHFHTLRHWRATMEYHKTRDLLHVMQFLGHRNIKTTMRYTQLIAFGDDDYVCKIADNVDQAKQLIESGFDYVTDIDEHKLFRKRK
jgi:integrase